MDLTEPRQSGLVVPRPTKDKQTFPRLLFVQNDAENFRFYISTTELKVKISFFKLLPANL